MSRRKQRYNQQEDDDEDFLVTPRARNRFRQGFSQFPEHRTERLRHDNFHSQQRASNRFYTQQGQHEEYYSHRRSHEDQFSYQRQHDDHFSHPRFHDDLFSRQRPHGKKHWLDTSPEDGKVSSAGSSQDQLISCSSDEKVEKQQPTRNKLTFNEGKVNPKIKSAKNEQLEKQTPDSNTYQFFCEEDIKSADIATKLEKSDILTVNMSKPNDKQENDNKFATKEEKGVDNIVTKQSLTKKVADKHKKSDKLVKIVENTEPKRTEIRRQHSLEKNDWPDKSKHKTKKSTDLDQNFESKNSNENNSPVVQKTEMTASSFKVKLDAKEAYLKGERIETYVSVPHKKAHSQESANKRRNLEIGKDKVRVKVQYPSHTETKETEKKNYTKTVKHPHSMSSKYETYSSLKLSEVGAQISQSLEKLGGNFADQSKDRKDKSRQKISRHISDFSNTNADSTSTFGCHHASSKKSDRITSSEISAFDLASDVFTDRCAKLHRKKLKTDSKQTISNSQKIRYNDDEVNIIRKEKDSVTDQKIKNTDEIIKNEKKQRENNSDDSDDSDSELSKFKTVLSQVNDSQWKTKPLINDSRRSSTQSVKSVDSNASDSLLQQSVAKKCLSKKALRKFGVSNVKYWKNRLYYRGICIRQPIVKITQQDIQNVAKHKKKLRRNLLKSKKNKLKRIKGNSYSSAESAWSDSSLKQRQHTSQNLLLSNEKKRKRKEKKKSEQESQTRNSQKSIWDNKKEKLPNLENKKQCALAIKQCGKSHTHSKQTWQVLSDSDFETQPDISENEQDSNKDSDQILHTDIKHQSIRKDILHNKIIEETESEISAPDVTKTSVDETDKINSAATFKSCEVALINIDMPIKQNQTKTYQSHAKAIPSDEISDITEIPETQMSVDQTSSSDDFPVFQNSPAATESWIDSLNKQHVGNEMQDEQDYVQVSQLNYTDDILSISAKKDNWIESNTEETQVYSQGKPKNHHADTDRILQNNADLASKSPIFRGNNSTEHDVVCTNPNTMENEDVTDKCVPELLEVNEVNESLICAESADTSVTVPTDSETSAINKQSSVNHSSSAEDIRKGIKTFQSKFLKFQQKEKKALKNRHVKRKIDNKGLLSDDETGEEGDIEDNISLLESVFDSEDSEFCFGVSNKGKSTEHHVNQTCITQGPDKGLKTEKDSEIKKHDKSMPVNVFEKNKLLNKLPKDNTEMPLKKCQSQNIVEPIPSPGKVSIDQLTHVYTEERIFGDKCDVESYTSSSPSSDAEVETEEVLILKPSEIKTESTSSNSVYPKENQTPCNDGQLSTLVLANERGIRKVDSYKNDKEGIKDLSKSLSLCNKQSLKLQGDTLIGKEGEDLIQTDINESDTHVKVKEEPVQIKEEPDWSKFSYTQEPDAVFVSDGDDVVSDILGTQTEPLQVDSGSGDDNFPPSSQTRILSLHDNEMQDPEYYDFASPEMSENEDGYCSYYDDTDSVLENPTLKMSAGDENKLPAKNDLFDASDTRNSEKISSGIGTLNVKKEEFHSSHTVVGNDDCRGCDKVFRSGNLEEDRIEESFSDSEFSDSDSNYVEINSSDNDCDGTKRKDAHVCQTDLATLNKDSEKIIETLPARSNEISEASGSFDTDKNLLASKKAKGSAENDLEQGGTTEMNLSAINFEENTQTYSVGPIFEVKTQIDVLRKDKNSEIGKEHDDIYNQATQILPVSQRNVSTSDESEDSSIDLDGTVTLSDSSLVDAADNQIHLYIQTKKKYQQTKVARFAEGLEIRYDKDAFVNKPLRNCKEPYQKMEANGKVTSSVAEKTEQRNSVDGSSITNNETDWYSKMTQVDPPTKLNGAARTGKDENKNVSVDANMALTNESSVTLVKTGCKTYNIDDQVQSFAWSKNDIVSAVKEDSDEDFYEMATQYDKGAKDMHVNEKNDHGSEKFCIDLLMSSDDSDSDHAAYGAPTQIDDMHFNLDTTEEEEGYKNDDIYQDMTRIDSSQKRLKTSAHTKIEKNKDDQMAYFALTQKDAGVQSDDGENDLNYLASTQIDVSYETKSVKKYPEDFYEFETQIDDDYSNQACEAELNKVAARGKQQASILHKAHWQDKSEGTHFNKSALSRNVSSEDSVEKADRLVNIKDKLKQSFKERKTIEIPMQKGKSDYEKKFGRQNSLPSSSVHSKVNEKGTELAKIHSTKQVYENTQNKPAGLSYNSNKPEDNIAVCNATESDMWLSKKMTKSSKTPTKLSASRKRRSTSNQNTVMGFKKSLQEARKQLADRSYQTIFRPEIRAEAQRKQKLDTYVLKATDLEDVDLPTCSQIISKGLPILNPTDMLVKKNKPESSSRFSSRAARFTDTMMETDPPEGKNETMNSSVTEKTSSTVSETNLNIVQPTSVGEKTTEPSVGSSALDTLKDKISSLQQETERDKIRCTKEDSQKNKTNSRKEDIQRNKANSQNEEGQKNETCTLKENKERNKINNQNEDVARKETGNLKDDNQSYKSKGVESIQENKTDSSKEGIQQKKTSSSKDDILRDKIKSFKEKLKNDLKQFEKAVKDQSAIEKTNDSSNQRKRRLSEFSQRSEFMPVPKTVKTVQRSNDTDSIPNLQKPQGLINKPLERQSSSVPRPDPQQSPLKPNTKQNNQGKPNSKDPRMNENKINLMLKRPIQNSDGSRKPHSGVQARIPPQPLGVITNRVPVHDTPNNQERGITFKEFLAGMLRWNPVWFEEHVKQLEVNRNAEPPPCTNGLPGNPTLFPLPEKYSSFKEYSDNFMVPLLLYETWESSFQSLREKQNRKNVLKHRLCPSAVYDSGDKLNECVLLGLLTDAQKHANQFFCEGDLVILDMFGTMLAENNIRSEPKWVKQLALVERVMFGDVNVNQLCFHNKELAKIRRPNSFSVKMILKTRKRKFYPDYNCLGEIMQVGSVVTSLRQFKALEQFPINPLCRHILWPTNNLTFCDKPQQGQVAVSTQEHFNQSQQRAIATASHMVSRPDNEPRICLLQGPPGTGKSHTVLGTINQILKDKNQKARICLCAQSHAAVDELLRRLDKQNKLFKQKGIGSAVKLIRIGKPMSVHEDIRYLCLDKLIEKNMKNALTAEKEKELPQSLQVEKGALENKIKTLREKLKNATDLTKKKLTIDLEKLQRQKDHLLRKCKVDISQIKRNPEQEAKIKHGLLYNAQVIAGTLSGIGGSVLKQYLEDKEKDSRKLGFDCIIIDEATQAIELDTLIPLQYGTTKLILVGDQEQLPPTVVSKVAMDNKFNLSLFERLNSHFRYSTYNPVIMLDTQYRMDPEICSFPSNYIYDGKLKTDGSVYCRNQCPIVPYLLFDIEDGREQLSQCSGSVSNPIEALFTVSLVEFITSNTNVTPNVIGIIAPYQKQKTLLVKHLQDSSLNGLGEIEVSTVDGFQGREKHVIIMSCVRAKSSTGTIGFVGSRNRMNVSLTRAKYALYVIAHFDSLQTSDEWKALIEDAGKRKRRIRVNEHNVNKALNECLKRKSTKPP